MARVAAIVVAAGQGVRAGGDLPKQFRRIGGDTLLQRALSAFTGVPAVSLVQPVIRLDDLAFVRTLTEGMNILPPVSGGATRQASVRAGLEALEPQKPDIVLIHDAARPFASSELIARAIEAVEKTGAAIPGLPVTDTVKRIDRTGTIETTLDRNSIRLVQTPQAFAFPALLKAHRHAATQGRDDFTDDAALAEWVGMKVSVFEGEPGNIKLTTPDDFARAEAIQSASLGDVRTGSGFDVHAFGPGDHVTLGGSEFLAIKLSLGTLMLTLHFMRSPMPFLARSPTATLARIFRQPIRNGEARLPTDFLFSQWIGCARVVALLHISI